MLARWQKVKALFLGDHSWSHFRKILCNFAPDASAYMADWHCAKLVISHRTPTLHQTPTRHAVRVTRKFFKSNHVAKSDWLIIECSRWDLHMIAAQVSHSLMVDRSDSLVHNFFSLLLVDIQKICETMQHGCALSLTCTKQCQWKMFTPTLDNIHSSIVNQVSSEQWSKKLKNAQMHA